MTIGKNLHDDPFADHWPVNTTRGRQRYLSILVDRRVRYMIGAGGEEMDELDVLGLFDCRR